MTRTAMPSPRGTNHERAFLPAGSRVTAAYDAEMDEGEADYAALLSFLADKLEAGDLMKVKRMLGLADAPEEEAGGASDAARRSAYAQDARDMHRRGYISTQEMERRIINGPRREQTAAEAADFAKRFPHAARLKI